MKPSKTVRRIGKLVATLSASEWTNLTLNLLVKMPDEVAQIVIIKYDEIKNAKAAQESLNETES